MHQFDFFLIWFPIHFCTGNISTRTNLDFLWCSCPESVSSKLSLRQLIPRRPQRFGIYFGHVFSWWKARFEQECQTEQEYYKIKAHDLFGLLEDIYVRGSYLGSLLILS